MEPGLGRGVDSADPVRHAPVRCDVPSCRVLLPDSRRRLGTSEPFNVEIWGIPNFYRKKFSFFIEWIPVALMGILSGTAK